MPETKTPELSHEEKLAAAKSALIQAREELRTKSAKFVPEPGEKLIHLPGDKIVNTGGVFFKETKEGQKEGQEVSVRQKRYDYSTGGYRLHGDIHCIPKSLGHGYSHNSLAGLRPKKYIFKGGSGLDIEAMLKARETQQQNNGPTYQERLTRINTSGLLEEENITEKGGGQKSNRSK